MIVNLYVIKDDVAGTVGKVMEANNDNQMLRDMKQLFRKQYEEQGTDMRDYTLIRVGKMDKETGKISAEDEKINWGMIASE